MQCPLNVRFTANKIARNAVAWRGDVFIFSSELAWDWLIRCWKGSFPTSCLVSLLDGCHAEQERHRATEGETETVKYLGCWERLLQWSLHACTVHSQTTLPNAPEGSYANKKSCSNAGGSEDWLHKKFSDSFVALRWLWAFFMHI